MPAVVAQADIKLVRRDISLISDGLTAPRWACTLRAMATAARIALLGPLAVDGGDVSLGPRDRVVLTALATRAGSVVSSESWPMRCGASGRRSRGGKFVAGCVMRLRRALGAEAIETTPQGYRLAVLADDVDVSRFEQSVGRAVSC